MKIEADTGSAVTRLAIKLIMLTFVRTQELIGATWDEIDMEAAEWRIPCPLRHEAGTAGLAG